MPRQSIRVIERVPATYYRSGGGGVVALAAVGLTAWLGYKFFIKPRVLVPIATKKFVERLQITDAGFDLDLKHTRGTISFVINNPNPRPMVINAIVGHITVYQADPKKPGFRLGDIDHFKPIVIKPYAGERVRLGVLIKAVNTAAWVASVVTGAWKGQIVNFQGTITANGRPWPINQTIKLSK